MRRFPLCLLLVVFLATAARTASAIEVRISSQALERTLRAQLFNGPDGRYYLRGDANSPCYVYAEAPRVNFVQDRIVVHVHAKAKLGTALHGVCIGVSLSTDADVSLVPEAEEESIGFRDARVERLSESRELNILLMPFLSHKLPAQMKVNAAVLMRQLLSRSTETTGYALSLDSLKLHSLFVEGPSLVMDADANLQVTDAVLPDGPTTRGAPTSWGVYPLRGILPLVGTKFMATNGSATRSGIHPTKWALPA
jgi:hypothetical protein